MNLTDYIQQAQREAIKQHINANSVVLNSKLKLVHEGYTAFGNELYRTPPMICGLFAFLSDELPDDIAFTILESPTPPLTPKEQIKQEARREFIDELRVMSFEQIADLIEKGY